MVLRVFTRGAVPPRPRPKRRRAPWLGPALGLSLGALASLGSPGCEHEYGGEGGQGSALEDVVYEGGTTHEALELLVASLEAEAPKEDPARAPRLSSPAEGALPASPPPVFAWKFGAEARAPAPPRLLPAERETRPGLLLGRVLGAALPVVPAAHAHGEPFSGTGTWLVFEAEGGAPLLRVFTGASSYAPDESAWAFLVGGGRFTLRLVSAEFEQNRIAPGGGPVAGDALSFTIVDMADDSDP